MFLNQPEDSFESDSVEKVWIAFCSEDTTADDTFKATIALWPHGNGTGFIAVQCDPLISTEQHTGLMSDGSGDTTYAVCDVIAIDDQSVTATALDYTNGLSTLAIDTVGCKYISCQITGLGAGQGAAADAEVYALLPVSTN